VGPVGSGSLTRRVRRVAELALGALGTEHVQAGAVREHPPLVGRILTLGRSAPTLHADELGQPVQRGSHVRRRARSRIGCTDAAAMASACEPPLVAAESRGVV